MKPSKKKPTRIPASGTPYKDMEPSQETTSSPQVRIKANQSAKKSPPDNQIADANKNNAGSKRENRGRDIAKADGYINQSLRNQRNKIDKTMYEIQDYAADS